MHGMGPWGSSPRADEIVSMLTICGAETEILGEQGCGNSRFSLINPLNSAIQAGHLVSMLTIWITVERGPCPAG